jgi:hypothetical protein
VVETDRSGRRHVEDHKLGAVAIARYNVVSWGVVGLVCGAVSGLTGGEGVLGFLEGGLLTGIAWGSSAPRQERCTGSGRADRSPPAG